MRIALLVILGLLFAGCSDPAPAEAPDEPDASGDDPVDETPGPIIPELPTRWNFTSEMGLTLGPVENTTIPVPGGTTGLVTQNLVLMEFQSPPFEAAGYVDADEVLAHLVLESDVPTPGTGVFDVAVWAGSTAQTGLFSFGNDPMPMTPGQPRTIDMDLSRPGQADMLVPAGESLIVLVGVGYPYESSAGTMHMHLGGDDGSHISWQVRPTVDPFVGASLTSDEIAGSVTGANPFLCGTVEGADIHHHDLAVPQNATVLRLVSSAPGADLDLDLFAGSEAIAGGHTPGDVEQIHVWGDVLAAHRGSTLTLTVSACLAADQAYTVTVETDG